MKTLCVLLLYLCSVNTAEIFINNDITTVDIVVRGLKDQFWSEDERLCLGQTELILRNVRNYTVWAVWIWNSMHHPVGTFYGSQFSLGNYDQCLQAPSVSDDRKIKTQYCLADVTLTGKVFGNDDRSVMGSTEPYVGIKTGIGRNLNHVTWGTCVPASCKPRTISKILKAIYLANPITSAVPHIVVDSCTIAGEKTEFSNGFYMFFVLITSLVAVAVLSTYYLYNMSPKSRELHSIANAFCLKRNWTSLTRKSNDEIVFLNILKLSIAVLAVSVHTTFFEIMSPFSNGLQFDEFMMETKNPFSNFVKHIDLPVDIFLMISGLILVNGFMERKKNPFVALVHRYFRLTASFAVAIFYVSAVSIYTGDGPVWQRFIGREQKACSENWLLSLLMLNNYINNDNICIIVSWYIPCDYQLAVLGTILYMLWQKNKSMGKIVTIITVVVAVLMPGIVTYWRQLPGLLLFHNVQKMTDFRTNDVFLDTYIRSHNRASPYFIGMAMGFILSIFKPKNYRNVISKNHSALLLAVASIVLFRVSTIPLSWTSLEYDHLESAIYAVYSRNLWAVATCLCIGVMEYGDIGILRKIINWHGFTVLSRLTYGIYLTHSLVIQQHLYSRKNIRQFDLVYSEVLLSIGILAVSTLLAVVLWLFVEAPLNNVVNVIINSRSKKKSPEDMEPTKAFEDYESDINKLKDL